MFTTLLATTLLAAATADTDIRRVGGDLEIAVTKSGEAYRSGRSVVGEALPVGYPRPTPPGAIEIKAYPAVRRAEVSGRSSPDAGMNMGFFPLFRHITEREIAMTAPVEVDYPDWSEDTSPREWTMSFLYRTPDLGPTGDAGAVSVVDAAPVTVLSIGMTGAYGMDAAKRGHERLVAWIDEHPEWTVAGPPRSLYYNDPSVPNAVKWSEVQIPIAPHLVASDDIIITPGDAHPSSEATTLLDLARDAGTFATLLAAVDAADLADALSGHGPFTIFAPTDDAFAAVDDATLDALLQPRNRDALVEVLSLHVVAGRVTASDAVAAGRASSLRDRELTFTITDGRLRVNDANVIANDLAATNGVVHVIDRVLLPDHLALQPESTPLRFLELAVERGAPLFNAGQHAACAAIYEIAAEAARLTSSERLAPSTIRTLDDALAEARSPQAHAATVAWSLRRALDAAYRDLDSLPTGLTRR